MPDREDPSQRLEWDNPGYDQGDVDTAITNHAVIPVTELDAPTPDELLDYSGNDPVTVEGLFTDKPGQFYVEPARTREAGVYRTIPNVSGFVTSGAGRIAGTGFRETTGAAGATVKLHDGHDASAPAFLEIVLGPSESARDWFLPGGIVYRQALFISVAGSISGGVYFAEDVNA